MKLKFWLNVATFVALALIIFFGWRDIEAAFTKMLTLNLWVLALTLPAQFLAFFSVAKVFQNCLAAVGQAVPLTVLFPATIELNFVNHVFPSGGLSGFSYLAFRLKQNGVSPGRSTLAQVARFLLMFVSFIGLLMAALLMLALEDKASRLIIFFATMLTVTIIFLAVGVVYVAGSEARIRSFTALLTRIANRARHLVGRREPETIRLTKLERTFLDLHRDFLLLKQDTPKLKRAFWWALAGNIGDLGLVYITFVAHGTWPNPGAVIISFAVAAAAGLVAILPGGLGVYEPLMVALLLSTGVEPGVALSATLVSRVIALGLALSSGYVLYHRAINRYAGHSPQR